jgi:glycosyltransferase involved in cell wall biosynthesis
MVIDSKNVERQRTLTEEFASRIPPSLVQGARVSRKTASLPLLDRQASATLSAGRLDKGLVKPDPAGLTLTAAQLAVSAAGALDGKVIVRYSHTYTSFGGVSIYIERLNAKLLEGNAVTIYQLYPAEGRERATERRIEQIGRGTLVYVPIKVFQSEYGFTAMRYEKKIRIRIRESLESILGAKIDWLRRARHKLYEPRWSGLAKFIPFFTGEIVRILRIKEQVTQELQTIQRFHRSTPILFIDHSPFDFPALYLRETARQLGIPRTIQYHGGYSAASSKIVAEVSKGIPTAGVTLKDLRGVLGPRAVNLADGIDTAFFDKHQTSVGVFRQKINIGHDVPLILVPARVVPQKGQHDLVRVSRLLLEQYGWTKAAVVFAGEVASEDSRRSIDADSTRARLDGTVSFIFTGDINAADLRDAYADADVVVLPSRSEGLSRVILEAQAMQVPIVATDAGGTSEAIKNWETGIIVPVGDIAALAEAVHRSVKDQALRAKLVESSRPNIEKNFSMDALAERHERFYLEVMGLSESTSVPHVRPALPWATERLTQGV